MQKKRESPQFGFIFKRCKESMHGAFIFLHEVTAV